MSANKLEIKFKSIYDNHVNALYNYVFYNIGDKEITLDIVQESFMKLWEKLNNINAGKEKSYLFTTARNLIINRKEREKVALKFSIQLTERRDSNTPDRLLQEKEFQYQLEEAINGLTQAEREVFLMHRYDGYKYKEIAELLDISQKAVEKRMKNALIKMRKLYKNI